jgi:citrate synthase
MSSNDKTQTSAGTTHSNSAAIDYLEQRRGKIISNTGGWFPGTGVFSHGYSMLEDLVGKKSYFQILILNATGKLVDKPFADWVEAIYGCLSWPDPRIWCNQIGALAGAARTSVVAATAMGSLAADSRTYGVFPLIEGVEFIQQALQQQEQGLTAQQIVNDVIARHRGKPYIVGYKRPIAKGDERLEIMEKVGRELGFIEGKHLQLAYAIEKVLLADFDEGMNINGYMSAFLSDQGFSAQEVYRMFSMLVASGVTACYLDVYQRPPDTFLPLRCDDIDYQGVAKRTVPAAAD